MNTESQPMTLRQYMMISELAAAKVGKTRLWAAAYKHARVTLSVTQAIAKANIVCNINLDETPEVQKADKATVQMVRAALDQRKCGGASDWRKP